MTDLYWSDGTLDREGWVCRYASAGASIRATDIFAPQYAAVSQCWIARSATVLGEVPSPDLERVVGLLRKIIQRGSAPAIHPCSERRLLEQLGLADQIEASPLPGDLSFRLRPGVFQAAPDAGLVWEGNEAESDPELHFDSHEERVFLRDWVPANLGKSAWRWILPQASLEGLVEEGTPGDGLRRVDFLVSPPGAHPFVVEIDGEQHSVAEDVDDGRDGALGSSGYQVVRVPTHEVNADSGPALDEVRTLWEDPRPQRDETHRRIVYGPVQLHRLVTALLEGMYAGFLTGDRWVVRVEDRLDTTIELFGPYLDLFNAVDRLWAGDIMPNEVIIGRPESWRSFRRSESGYEDQPVASEVDAVDLIVRLEPDRSPVDALPSPEGSTPEIVVRSAYLPVSVAEAAYEGAMRAGVRSEHSASAHALRVILQAVFAKDDFLEGQLDALIEIVEGRDCAVLLPTGGGKSLIYQLAGLCLPGRTLIIDPLVALMEDQAEGLRGHGIDRDSMVSAFQTRRGESDAILQQIAAGESLFVFAAPERLQQQAFRNALRALAQVSPINLAVVDEAHCVSEWGHDFRTSYLNLGKTLREVGRDSEGKPPPLLALTGTASRAVLRDVLIELEIERESERSIVRPQSFDRQELRFNIVKTEPREAMAALTGFLRTLPRKFNVSDTDFFRGRGERTHSGIVFCPHVNGEFGVLEIAQQCAAVTRFMPPIYSGGPPRGVDRDGWDETKRQNARSFKGNKSPLLVSTKAFGMGIDKPNIRYVCHFGIPGSIEAYYQEVGRAGRDRQRAECGLVLVDYDPDRARRLLDEDTDLEETRSEHDLVNRVESDDVTRQLFFHLNSFQGISDEINALKEMLTVLGEIGRRRSVEVAMGENDADRQKNERALHRLVVLGVVADYLVEWGSRKFPVELAVTDSQEIVDNLSEYVRRNQPGRIESIRAKVESAASKSPAEAAAICGRELIHFIYDTVERSRRRSLREMWLAARENSGDANDAFRARILDYLTQGDIAPTLERLVDQEHFHFDEWIDELSSIDDEQDARELRGNTARLLSSYPDHPGLLLARAHSEAVDSRGDLREFGSNLEAGIQSAQSRYGVSDSEVDALADWLLEAAAELREGALVMAVAVCDRLRIGQHAVDLAVSTALTTTGADPGLRVFALASRMERVERELTSALTLYTEREQ